MAKTHAVAVIPGDGIGPEVVREGLRVLERVAASEGFSLRLTRYPFGAEHYLATKEVLPDSAFEEIRGQDAILLGAIGDPRIQTGYLEFGIIARLRFGRLVREPAPGRIRADTCARSGKTRSRWIRGGAQNTEDATPACTGISRRHAGRDRDGDPVHAQRRERVIRHAFELARRARGLAGR